MDERRDLAQDYRSIPEEFVPAMREAGFSEELIAKLMHGNPGTPSRADSGCGRPAAATRCGRLPYWVGVYEPVPSRLVPLGGRRIHPVGHDKCFLSFPQSVLPRSARTSRQASTSASWICVLSALQVAQDEPCGAVQPGE